ncbi:hypothetical protein [Fuchsiella alkaliacetigena]|uniref:hypothetical protein n=1 Tax=Fuchsiella alkaliacetigena TaxID=957042 RepID=UPI00200BA09B|nr:hypothetical protein [Fuchsiella alkaliacetigena]MCK8825904.1 hypothetical protein [Fuchsiella alkaliacetigena]
MRLKLVRELLASENPVEVVWKQLQEIYITEKNETDNILEYYSRTEKELLELEKFLFKSYFEFYQEDLKELANREDLTLVRSLDDNPNLTYLLMDALSLRELGLFYDSLEQKGYQLKIDYTFSALPSQTRFYKEKMRFDIVERNIKFREIRDYQDIKVRGNEQLIWSRYPDTLIEDIRSGQSLKSDLEETYKKTKQVLFTVLDNLDKEKIIICSDHGYTRTEAGYNIKINNKTVKKWLKELFGGSRFAAKEEANKELAAKLLDRNLIVEVEDHYLPISHYSWPVSGKYSTFSHGGLSLLEVITPRIILTK